MNLTVLLPALTSILALIFSLLVFDQWRERRRGYQLIWALGMLFFGIASGCEAIGGGQRLERARSTGPGTSTGAVWTAGWLGLGTAFLLGRTRFGYTFAVLLVLAGLVMLACAGAVPSTRMSGASRSSTSSSPLVLAIADRRRDVLLERALAADSRRWRSSERRRWASS